MIQRLTTLLTIMIAVWMITPSNAQESDALYFNAYGDLWTWNGAMTEQLTEWRFNGNPILSPDGRRIAYASVASEAVERGGTLPSEDSHLVYAPTPTNNIWVMETATRDFARIADQGTSFPLLRGQPAWSPDGTQLAWVEYGADDETFNARARLMVYNFTTRQTRNVAFVNLGFQDGGLRLPPIQWGEAGIAYRIFTYVESGGAQTQLFVVNPINNQVSQFVVHAADSPLGAGGRSVVDHVMVTHDGIGMVALLYSDNTWTILNPATASTTVLRDAPYMVPRNGISARLTPIYTENLRGPSITWRSTASNGQQRELLQASFGLTRGIPTLSPDGRTVAYVDADGINYERIDGTANSGIALPFNGERQFTNLWTQSVVWTPLKWVTTGATGAPVPTPTIPNPTVGSVACELPLPFVLRDFVTVQSGVPNNLRANPSVNADFITSLYPGDFVSISDGPVCADGFRWWEIAGGGGFTGWTAEGAADGSDAWLIHIEQSVMVNDCPLPPRLQRGDRGVVLPGDPNVIRNGPDANGFSVIGQIPGNGEFTVNGSSLCGTDGRRWFPITYNGIEGWTAEGEGSTYWIAPLG